MALRPATMHGEQSHDTGMHGSGGVTDCQVPVRTHAAWWGHYRGTCMRGSRHDIAVASAAPLPRYSRTCRKNNVLAPQVLGDFLPSARQHPHHTQTHNTPHLRTCGLEIRCLDKPWLISWFVILKKLELA